MFVSLLDNPILVQTPFIKVTIGDYVFGIFHSSTEIKKDTESGVYIIQNIQYPNYIQALTVQKLNGQVNQYTLHLNYPITPNSDPNFIDKVLSKVQKSRKMILSYGDLSAPAYLYKEEETLIIDVQANVNLKSGVLQYQIQAVSSAKLGQACAFNFINAEFTGMHKPSDIIKKILKNNPKYGLLDLFSGMRDEALIRSNKLIADDDIIVYLEPQYNMTPLDYLRYLVKNMRRSIDDTGVYIFEIVDDISNIFNGPYFKVVHTDAAGDSLDTYDLVIGYPNNTAVTDLTIANNEGYSIFFSYSKELNTSEYVQRIEDNGDISEIYAPVISSDNKESITHSNDISWWNNVTQYPISVTIKLKGLLRPAVLMSKVRLTVLFYGQEYIASGLYIINKQEDSISTSEGFFTTLNMVRIDGANISDKIEKNQKLFDLREYRGKSIV